MPAVKGCHSMAPGFLGLLRVPIDSTEGSSVLPPHYCAVQSTPPKCEIQEQGGILVGGLANTPYPTSLMRDYQCDLVGRTAGAFGVKRRSYNGQKSSDFAFSSAIWRKSRLDLWMWKTKSKNLWLRQDFSGSCRISAKNHPMSHPNIYRDELEWRISHTGVPQDSKWSEGGL